MEYSTVTLFIAEQIHERYMVNAAVATVLSHYQIEHVTNLLAC